MTGRLLIVRPEPGAERSADLARALGLEPIVVPLFTAAPLAWTPPDPAGFEALLLTSAQAPRLAGPALALYAALPCFAVGPATAAAAEAAGLHPVGVGASDGAEIVAAMKGQGVGRTLHPCGRHHRPLPADDILHLPVYVSAAIEPFPAAAREAALNGALVLLHSPRAAGHFARHLGCGKATISIAAISPQVAAAAGAGWKRVAAAPAPTDQALLELAAKLCQTERR